MTVDTLSSHSDCTATGLSAGKVVAAAAAALWPVLLQRRQNLGFGLLSVRERGRGRQWAGTGVKGLGVQLNPVDPCLLAGSLCACGDLGLQSFRYSVSWLVTHPPALADAVHAVGHGWEEGLWAGRVGRACSVACLLALAVADLAVVDLAVTDLAN